MKNIVSTLEFLLLHNDLAIFIRHIIRFIKRLPSYLKLAWQQEDWDFEYLYDLIEFKLKEFKAAQENDTLHAGTKKYIRQINITLQRLDRYRNWPDYYDYPMDDIIHTKLENGNYSMSYTNEQNEKQRCGAWEFEKKNHDKFWKDLIKYHHHWWT